MKSKSKSEIADAAGVSQKTLARGIGGHREKLRAMGVSPSQRILPPRAVEYVCRELGIHEEDFAA